ncbi:ubiquitin carboxyl-terminal hydrolase 29 [Choloepus didactylus]|uniref:ubiquitin carboxyl-terminal hydrolase 29 n=1 Tax=Choloepus didactylus TaxID=27675 RepID=UPI0018A10BBE|nr:ubiquitin carboxyl-terminal hydrolase 29 [Choloepus didactylus]
MTPLKVHGFVQIWSKKTGMTKSREAFIKIVEKRKKIRLVVRFESGQFKRIFQLSNNITRVVLRHHRDKQSRLHLALQNNSSLIINNLSCRDAEELKAFLDTVHQNKFQKSMKLDSNWSAFDSRITQKKINKTPLHKICDVPSYGSFNTEKGSRIPDLQKMPSLTPESSTIVRSGLLENQCGWRKRMLSSHLDMNEDFLKEYKPVLKKKPKTDSWTYVSSNRKKQSNLKALERDGKLKFGLSLQANSTGNPNTDETVLSIQTLYAKGSSESPLEPNWSQNDPGQNNPQVPLDSHPEQLWKGFPNLGNTCYMNATLQSLFAIPSFADDLLWQGVPWENIPLDALIVCLTQLLVLKDISNPEIKEELLVNVKNSVSAVAEIFSGNMQNDAHEFLGQCLDQLKGDMEKLNSSWKAERENLSPQISAIAAATKVFVCPVVANFEFELQRSIVCKGCSQVVIKRELSNYLSIDLPQGMRPFPLSVQNSFDLFFTAEELEYNCEKCKHKDSVAMHKFSKIPRVLIVHLKRYCFNDVWFLVKDDQQVDIPKYLSLSCHCDECTKPPLPLCRNIHSGDSQVLKVSQEEISGNISPSTPSLRLISESKSSMVLYRGSDKEAEPQKYPALCEESSQEKQQNSQENGSELTIKKSELINSRNVTVSLKELPAADSVMSQVDNSLSMISEDRGKPTISPDTGFVEMPENPELKKYEKTNSFIELHFDSIVESTENFYEDKENRFPAGSQGRVEKLQQHDGERTGEEFLQQALPQSLRNLDAQELTEEDLIRATEVSVQKANMNSFRASEVEAKELKRNAKMGDPLHAYRLISVVSHVGSSADSGHYISDVYDFERQAWFTISDLRVSEIQETVIQEARLCDGYIFFYMHNEIFEELFEKTKNCPLPSMEAGAIHQGE